MKGSILAALGWVIISAAHTFAADPAQPTGFMGFPWGTEVNHLRTEALRHCHGTLDYQFEPGVSVRLRNGKFAGQHFDTLEMYCRPGLSSAYVYFVSINPNHQKEFDLLRNMLIQKYGPPYRDETDECSWTFPKSATGDSILLSRAITGRGPSLSYITGKKFPVIEHPPKATPSPGQATSTPAPADDL